MKDIYVYPTSILPDGATLEPLREAKIVASSLQIEVVHIVCFLFILALILGTSWYAIIKTSHEKKTQSCESKCRAMIQLPLNGKHAG